MAAAGDEPTKLRFANLLMIDSVKMLRRESSRLTGKTAAVRRTTHLGAPTSPDYDGHSCYGNRRTHDIPRCQWYAIDFPKPYQGNHNIDASVSGIHPSRCSGMQRQKPTEECKTQRCGNQQPDGRALSEPQIRKVATDDLGKCSQHEKSEDADKRHQATSSTGLGSTKTTRRYQR